MSPMGTHNALLRLGERFYLEVIAIDPDGIKPPRPRWFDLDDITLQSALTRDRSLCLGRAHRRHRCSVAGVSPPAWYRHAVARGDYRWRITIPDDGKRPGKGFVPTLIQWDVPTHPADRLPPTKVTIAQVAAAHADPAFVRALAALGLAAVVQVTYDRHATPRRNAAHTPRHRDVIDGRRREAPANM